jgi:two-component system osmolarity sensor histidine kinase EnvZ
MRSIYKFVPKTLLARFLLIITVPTIIGQAAAIYLFYDRHWYNVSYHTSKIIAKDIALMAHLVEKGDYDTASIVSKTLGLNYSLHPNEVFKNINTPEVVDLEIFQKMLAARVSHPGIIGLSLDEDKVIVDLQLNNKVLRIQFPAKPLMNPTTYVFVLWIMLLTLLLLTTSLIFSKNQLRSILELTKAADEFGRGIKPARGYKPSGAEEVRLAGVAFIKMRDRIERQIHKRTQMLAMISHDLRTPLTRIKLQLELMDQSDGKEEIAFDVQSMEQMIASYLDFVNGEGGEAFKQIHISTWFKENIPSVAPQTLKIEYGKIEEELVSNIKPHAFKRAIANLLGNAAKYASIAKLSLYQSPKEIRIEIEDNGSGIPDSEKSLVFKPFYRSDKARRIDDSYGSVGLGLAITKEIIQGHKGSIVMMDSKTLGGLLVRISLPLA